MAKHLPAFENPSDYANGSYAYPLFAGKFEKGATCMTRGVLFNYQADGRWKQNVKRSEDEENDDAFLIELLAIAVKKKETVLIKNKIFTFGIDEDEKVYVLVPL